MICHKESKRASFDILFYVVGLVQSKRARFDYGILRGIFSTIKAKVSVLTLWILTSRCRHFPLTLFLYHYINHCSIDQRNSRVWRRFLIFTM